MKRIQYPSLNGLRAISILLVLMLHLSLKNNIFDSFSDVKWIQPLLLFLKDGAMGVNVFFVISGFLITSLLQEEQQNYGSISLKNFYIRRTLRIFPAYFFLLFVYFLLQSFSIIEISNASWLTSITYTKYLNGQLDWYTAHSWSLSLEELFYLFWPVVFIGGEKTRKIIAFSIVIAVLAVRTYIHFVDSVFVEQLFIFAKMDAIAIGCLFAIYKDYILEKISAYWALVFYFSISALFFLRYFPLIASKIHLGFFSYP